MVAKLAKSARTGAAREKEIADIGTRKGTRERILEAAIEEFCNRGREGASTARIVKTAECNIRMLYHYFDNKDGLYRAALLQVYAELREAEAKENFWTATPTQGVARLVQFTFDYMHTNRRFPKMILAENLAEGTMVSHMNEPYSGSRPLIANLEQLIERGRAMGEFHMKPRALDLYLTILALSFIHISNQHTLTVTFGEDLSCDEFIASRRQHVTDVILGYLGVTRTSH